MPQKEQDRKRESLRKFPPALLPTFVVRRKTRTALVHRSSAIRSRTVKRSLPLPVAFRTSAHSVFCCIFHFLQCLSRCSRVCVLYRHHPQAAVSEFFVHSRYCPVRQCPVLSWWNRSASLLRARTTTACCLIFSRILYFLLFIRFSHQPRASAHFLSATSRIMLAMDVMTFLQLVGESPIWLGWRDIRFQQQRGIPVLQCCVEEQSDAI